MQERPQQFVGSLPGELRITHIIYHIPGKKIGCTKQLDGLTGRKHWYPKKLRDGLVRYEDLYNCTDQEAGDREWFWADAHGYRRGHHYTVAANRKSPPKDHFKQMGKKGGAISGAQSLESGTGLFGRAPEKRKEDSRKAGLIGGAIAGRKTFELGIGLHAIPPERQVEIRRRAGAIAGRLSVENKTGIHGLTKEQRSANSSKVAIQINERGLGGAVRRVACPHCGLESNLMILKRWHFDKCPKRPSLDVLGGPSIG